MAQAYLEEAAPEFIMKDEWPPQSSDCSSMDYATWKSFKEKVCRGVQNGFTEQALMNRMITSWEEISIEEIRKSISAWKKRLRLVVEEDGGDIEHRLKQMNFTLILHFLRRRFEFDNTHIICN